MQKHNRNVIFRKDYREPEFYIPNIELEFNLNDTSTIVKSKLNITRNKKIESSGSLVLNGENLKLISLVVDGKELSEDDYSISDEHLSIRNPDDKFILEIQCEIDPLNNSALEGLYKSGDIFCTQNEPEGFRRITYYIDRPDVMSKFRTTIIASKSDYPVLLSNGNPIERKDIDDKFHSVTWEDPFPKPAYLFALVAGDLGVIKDEFVTMNGRDIALEIYCDRGNEKKCYHAMESIKKSMKWDEDRFNLEYDLDIYMIVAVDTFNMGAMENKGLNIFNSQYVLADAESATDSNFLAIEGVIGHEYFHNWTGNRVTCRDWFQLTLKEGLTVFRDQEFSSDMQSRAVNRIGDVNALRTMQFVEDAGPMSHPIRPENYMEINNFYTLTVYEKGAEVIRMIHTIIGEEKFQQGMKIYFDLYDGMAVSCDDFVSSMAKASGYDFSQFMLWYEQSGTPVLDISESYSVQDKCYTIEIEQTIPDTQGQKNKRPMHISVSLGLLNNKGQGIKLDGDNEKTEKLIMLTKKTEKFSFDNLSEKPVLSINRNFTSPVKINTFQSIEDVIFLFSNDSDPVNRWDNGQRAVVYYFKSLLNGKEGELEKISSLYKEAFRNILDDRSIDAMFLSTLITIPDESLIAQDYNPVDFDGIHDARESIKLEIAKEYKDILYALYQNIPEKKEYTLDLKSIGNRSLSLKILSYLSLLGGEFNSLVLNHFTSATNMTDEIGALSIISNMNIPERDQCFEEFYNKWKDNFLVMTKWFAVQASSSKKDLLKDIVLLENNPIFDIKVPNLVRALIGAFSRNTVHFHNKSGSGYKYIADKILVIDKFNPSIASSLSGSFNLYLKTDNVRQEMIKRELERILEHDGLSKNSYEIIYKTLNDS